MNKEEWKNACEKTLRVEVEAAFRDKILLLEIKFLKEFYTLTK